jgi:hypothetical protein
VARLDWRLCGGLFTHSMEQLLAGHAAVARSGQRAVLRRLPPAGPACAVADYYDFFLQRLAEIPPA